MLRWINSYWDHKNFNLTKIVLENNLSWLKLSPQEPNKTSIIYVAFKSNLFFKFVFNFYCTRVNVWILRVYRQHFPLIICRCIFIVVAYNKTFIQNIVSRILQIMTLVNLQIIINWDAETFWNVFSFKRPTHISTNSCSHGNSQFIWYIITFKVHEEFEKLFFTKRYDFIISCFDEIIFCTFDFYMTLKSLHWNVYHSSDELLLVTRFLAIAMIRLGLS